MEYELIATATFGIEAVLAKELKALGYEDLKVENGSVSFQGDERDIAACNIWLRTADRILIKMKEFKAESFEELFQGTLSVDFGALIPENGVMHITGKSIKSKLHSVPDCQGIVKKAVVEAMKRKYNKDWFSEDGPIYKIEVAILKDIVTLTIDTTGAGLHKRGYRENSGGAPLKETLAAALVLLSDWNTDKLLVDPMCGSGTIAIEAALIGKNIAPGLNRSFVSESWPTMDEEIWEEARNYAKRKINDKEFKILCSDIDGWVIKTGKDNARKAGVYDFLSFERTDVADYKSSKKYGVIISNPPYGERIGEIEEVKELYKVLGRTFENLDSWSYYILTANKDFQELFGRRAEKNRKLYNGRILCYYYQYTGNANATGK